MNKVKETKKTNICILCGCLTTGSVGKAGHYWSMICQACKDEEDSFLEKRLQALSFFVKKVKESMPNENQR